MKVNNFIKMYGIEKAKEVLKHSGTAWAYNFNEDYYFEHSDVQDNYSIYQCDSSIEISKLKKIVDAKDSSIKKIQELEEQIKSKCCIDCDDGNGKCVFPYYGLAPHIHTKPIDGTVFTGEFPKNFSPDEDGMGVYTHCLRCGESLF